MELGWRLADIGGEGEKLVSKGVSCWLGESWKSFKIQSIFFCLLEKVLCTYNIIIK